MEIFKILKENKFSVLGMLIVLVAALFGADASVAMAEGATPPLEDTKGLTTQQPNVAASTSQLRKDTDIVDPEIDQMIINFRPWMFPIDTHMRHDAIQVPVKGYEVDHYAAGVDPLWFETSSQITNNSTKAKTVTLPVTGDAFNYISQHGTIYFPDVESYNEKGEEDGMGLLCFVTEKTSSTITIEALNGPRKSGAGSDTYVPDIASGARLLVGTNALSESEMLCQPEYYNPAKKTVFLQKSAVNIVMTDHWKEVNKRIPFIEQDVRDDALYKFRRKRSVNLIIGVQSKVSRPQPNMGNEYVYTSEGVKRQVIKIYGHGEHLLFSDLIALTKLQFAEYSQSNEANAYCGKDFIENLLNIDFTQYKDVSFTEATEMGIDIRKFKTTFGTINFIHEPIMNEVDMSDQCLVLDVKNAVRYVKENGKDYKVDMKEGVGENREASRDIHIEADCLALRGFNSILVGPSARVLRAPNSNSSVLIDFTEEATIPTEGLVDGKIILLTADDQEFPAGSLLQYDATTKTWSEYSGEIAG